MRPHTLATSTSLKQEPTQIFHTKKAQLHQVKIVCCAIVMKLVYFVKKRTGAEWISLNVYLVPSYTHVVDACQQCCPQRLRRYDFARSLNLNFGFFFKFRPQMIGWMHGWLAITRWCPSLEPISRLLALLNNSLISISTSFLNGKKYTGRMCFMIYLGLMDGL